jgi:TolB-like protein/tetratricopeptide (TPR) repeat protein/predicted Ser/Thr protein kinase
MSRTVESDDATTARPPTGHVAPGSVLAGRYEVGAILGKGGMGSVHLAIDRELGERVALKVLSRVVDGRADVLERFRREVRMARRVTHRNAVRTFDIGEHEGLHFLTMELVEGESLAELLRREGRLSTERIVELGRQICDGLAAVHEAGIVHRDLKPSNVLVAASGRIVLTDFGVARTLAVDDALTQDSRVLVGTPHYMAPEQLSGGPVTLRADLYALGLVLYEVAAGRRPFDRLTGFATAAARLHDDPEPLRHHASVPAWLEHAIMACLQREPERRPSDAGSVRTLLEPHAVEDAETRLDQVDDDTHLGSGDVPRTVDVTVAAVQGTHAFSQSLAVLPLRYRGPADEAYLAEAMTEQLVDLLSMTRGLRVPAVGATQRFAEDRDPRAVGTALGVDVVVDGTVQRAGPQLRVAVRLLDARTGYQTWSDHVDGELRDVFALQDHIATRVVETLRLRLETSSWEGTVPVEAIEPYLRARLRMRSFVMGGTNPDGAAALLERCLAIAPDFAPAWAAHATVCSRMWFFQEPLASDRDWAARGTEAVARALALAPRLPDAHLGAARMLAQEGRFAEAVSALQRALELAPTHAATHAFLGILQCEAGRLAEGIRQIELALELDPVDVSPMYVVARHVALHGDRDRCDAIVQRLWHDDPDTRLASVVLQVRLALWDGDLERLRHWRDVVGVAFERGRLIHAVATYALGETGEDLLLATLEQVAPAARSSPRFRALQEQCVVEGLLARGRDEEALVWLERLADGILIDVDWLDRCPLLLRLAEQSRMWPVKQKVRDRVQELWAMR